MNEVEPPVVRVLDVPAGALLPDVHDLLQAAIGWTDSHLHQFVSDGVHWGMPDADAFGDERDEAAGDDTEVIRRLRSWFGPVHGFTSILASDALASLSAEGPATTQDLAGRLFRLLGDRWVTSQGDPMDVAGVQPDSDPKTPPTTKSAGSNSSGSKSPPTHSSISSCSGWSGSEIAVRSTL